MKRPVIICVDDEESILVTLKKQLKFHLKDEYSIEVAESGEEALELLNELMEEKVDIPLFISDQIMPGIKGDRLLARVNQLLPSTLKILLTGQASVQDVGMAVNRANLYRYIEKPWEEINFILTVSEALHSYQQQKEIVRLRQLDQLKNEFVSNVSHELRTPLSIIKSYVEALLFQVEKEDYETQKNFLTVVNAETDRLSQLVLDLLDISRIEKGKFTIHLAPVSLPTLLETLLANFKFDSRHRLENQQDIPIRLTITPDFPEILADEDKIKQIFINLISNALKFSPDGGEIQVSVSVKGNVVECLVADQGIGIPEKDYEHIFEMFYRVDNSDTYEISGTGLGLPIVKYIVEAHDGHISVTSEQGKGSVFKVTLPIKKPAPGV